MENNQGNKNKGQDQWRNRDRDWRNRNQGNTDYDDRMRQRNESNQHFNYADESSSRFSDAGNFSSNYGSGSPGNNWNDNQRGYGNERGYGNDYNRQGRNDDMNRNFGNSDYNRSGNSRYSGNDYGRSNEYFGRENYRNDNDRNWWDKTTDEVSSWFGDDEAERRRRMDKMSGPHRGKGPKGFTRSDEKIRDDVNDKLYHDPFVDASDIDVTVSGGDVTLTGTVDSKETKRRAEDLAEEVIGVNNVSNNLKVNKSSFSSGTSQHDTSKSGSKDISENYRRN
jgi:osmotically-inducible protein OsmY